LPAGVVNVVFGTGEKAGQAVTSHPGTHLISFTGSTATAHKIRLASAPFCKKLSLEVLTPNSSTNHVVRRLLPRDAMRCDAMHSADYAIVSCPSVCLSVPLSYGGIVLKQLNMSSNFLHSRVASHTILIFPYQTLCQYCDGH